MDWTHSDSSPPPLLLFLKLCHLCLIGAYTLYTLLANGIMCFGTACIQSFIRQETADCAEEPPDCCFCLTMTTTTKTRRRWIDDWWESSAGASQFSRLKLRWHWSCHLRVQLSEPPPSAGSADTVETVNALGPQFQRQGGTEGERESGRVNEPNQTRRTDWRVVCLANLSEYRHSRYTSIIWWAICCCLKVEECI